eukprot:Gb_38023 [translate_table: standard]
MITDIISDGGENVNILDELLQNGRRYQEETLQKILQDNANCEYLVSHGLTASRATKEAFKECIPIIDYSSIEEYVEGIAEGDIASSMLCNYPIRVFALSSGTSTGGKPKKFPMTNEYYERFHAVLGYFEEGVKKRAYPPSEYPGLYSGKNLSIFVASEQYKTKAGYLVGPLSTNIYRSMYFKANYESYRYTSPIEVGLCGDGQQVMYCHLLCGLLQASDVHLIETSFAFMMAEFFKTLQRSWQQLCEDIRNGTLNEMITEESIRQAMSNILKPNLELASFVEKECSKSSWEGIVRRLWPNTVYLQCIATGPVMKSYVSRINYFSGNLPLVTRHYGATEGGNVGLNLDMKRPVSEVVQFTFMPTTSFYEFIPLKMEEDFQGERRFMPVTADDKPQIVDSDDLEMGNHYDVVLTTFQGLYRYRLGDVLRFVGFNKECPVFEYIGRQNVLLAVNYDNIHEAELQRVMEKASEFLKQHGVELLDYTSCVNQSCIPGHYVVFVEVESNPNPDEDQVMQECCCLVDSSFNYHYKKDRKSGMIGALEVRVCRRGTFEEIMKHSLKQGAAMTQYKPPRCVVSPSLKDILNRGVSRVYKSTFSSWNI